MHFKKIYMKKLLLLFEILLLSIVGYGQTTINFDDLSKWNAGSGVITSYQIDHEYIDGIFSATGGRALRNTTSTQDGFVGAFGTYSWRLENSATVDWRITIASGGVDSFSIYIRRWDNSPDPNYSLDYSIDGGSSWILVSLINNTALGGTSNWVTFNGIINSHNSNILIRLKSLGPTERIMIDNFYWTPSNPPCIPTEYPYMTGAFINSCNGSCHEGNNEILFLNAGSCPFTANTSNIKIYYENTSPATVNYTESFVSNASYVTSLNNAAAASGCASPLFIDASNGITEIPANATIFIMQSNPCYEYNFSAFCSVKPIYILFTSDDSWVEAGNFANSATPGIIRYFRTIINGITYDYNYEPNLLTLQNNGDCVSWPVGGGVANAYFNDGCTPALPVLPIELSFISGTRTSESSITINWTTVTETNNNYFEVQKLIGDYYQIIDVVHGSGNSNQEINYEYTDNDADIKVQYYRLRQVDYDGNFEYYGPIAVDASLNYKYNLVIYPNSTDDKINIKLNYKGVIEKITLTTISGKEVPVGFNVKCDGETNITLATSNIESGTYLIKFSFDEGEYICKDKIIINK